MWGFGSPKPPALAGNWQQRRLIRTLQFLRSNLHSGHGFSNVTGRMPNGRRRVTRTHGIHDSGACFLPASCRSVIFRHDSNWHITGIAKISQAVSCLIHNILEKRTSKNHQCCRFHRPLAARSIYPWTARCPFEYGRMAVHQRFVTAMKTLRRAGAISTANHMGRPST